MMYILKIVSPFILFYIVVVVLAILFVVLSRKSQKDKFIKEKVSYFIELENKYNAQFPIMMQDISSDFPEIMPSDSDKACIFFSGEDIYITKINDPSFLYKIKKDDLRSPHFHSYDLYENIVVYFYCGEEWCNLDFYTENLKYFPRKFVEENKDLLSGELFIKKYYQVLKTRQKSN